MAEKFEVRCSMNENEIPLTKHHTKAACDRRYRNLVRFLPEVLCHTTCKLRIWSQDPKGTILQQSVFMFKADGGGKSALSKPAFLDGLDDPGVLVGSAIPDEIIQLGPAVTAAWHVLFAKLAAMGIVSFVLVYDGSKTQEISCYTVEGELVTVPDEIELEIKNMCYYVIPNDDDYGEVHGDVVGRKVTVQHNSRVTEEGHTLEWYAPPAEEVKP